MVVIYSWNVLHRRSYDGYRERGRNSRVRRKSVNFSSLSVLLNAGPLWDGNGVPYTHAEIFLRHNWTHVFRNQPDFRKMCKFTSKCPVQPAFDPVRNVIVSITAPDQVVGVRELHEVEVLDCGQVDVMNKAEAVMEWDIVVSGVVHHEKRLMAMKFLLEKLTLWKALGFSWASPAPSWCRSWRSLYLVTGAKHR